MERTLLKNLSISMLGALIGAFIALQVTIFLWPLGMFAGGLFAYFASDWAGVRRGCLIAWRRTVSWRPNVIFWKYIGALCSAGTLLALTVVHPIVYFEKYYDFL
jgi:hypothetical protein